MTTPRELANLLPDIPLWVDTRGLLLSEHCRIFGFDSEDSLNFVVSSTQAPLAAVVGHPAPAAIREAVEDFQSEAEVVSSLTSAHHVAEVLNDWRMEVAILHSLPPTVTWELVEEGDSRILERADLPELRHLPPELKRELEIATDYLNFAAAFLDSRAASFCWTYLVTETYWDVSVETLKPYQRKGLAYSASISMINYMRTLRKEPVWGAVESNHASLALAHKIGFKEVDRLMVFER